MWALAPRCGLARPLALATPQPLGQRRLAPSVRTARPIACVLPTNTTIRLARVTAVYSRVRRGLSQADVVLGTTYVSGGVLLWLRGGTAARPATNTYTSATRSMPPN